MGTSNFEEVELGNPTEGDDDEVNIGLVGETGSGKSSFINAIMRFEDTDEKAARTGVTNTTSEPKCYPHPRNPDIKLWNLPSLNTTTYSNAKIYCEKLDLKKYDAFLLFTNTRFTQNALVLAKRLESMKKSFFLIRTKIDVDILNESKKKTFNEEEMLKEIKENILKSVQGLHCKEEHIFLISNVNRNKWEFHRLNEAVIKQLPSRQTSAGCLPLPTPTSNFTSMFPQTEQQENNAKATLQLLSHLKRHLSEAKQTIQDHGIVAAQNMMKKRLERWHEIDISLAIVGDSGTGKSSFINAIRGIDDPDDPKAAKTGVTETTMTPCEYPHPANPKIKLWDIPGIGTPNFPNLKTYCKKVEIGKYDTFIIMGAVRFTEKDVALAQRLRTIKKPFFFVRAKIDIDYMNEKKKKQFNEKEMLKKIRADCSTNLKGLIAREDDIFLISNNYEKKWDFPRLTQAILNNLSHHKKESFCLSMYALSKDILEGKVNALKGRIWMVALKSIIVKVFTSQSYSQSIDFQLIVEKVEFYRSQLGFPKQDSEAFQGMTKELQEQVRFFYLTDDTDVNSWLKKFYSDGADVDPSPKSLNRDEDIDAPFTFVYRSLQCVLDEMTKIALKILNDATRQEQDDDIL